MNNFDLRRRFRLLCAVFALAITVSQVGHAEEEWCELFDGQSLNGWRASEHAETWSVRDGCLFADGQRSHLFYEGPVGEHNFRNFELRAEVKTQPSANSGIFFHTQYQQSGWPTRGYELQINNTHRGTGKYRELKRTGSLYAVRNIYKPCVADNEWFEVRLRVVENRIEIWVNDQLTVDYLQPDHPARSPKRSGRVLAAGTIALQGHDPSSQVAFRRVAIRQLPDDARATDRTRASDAGYGLRENQMDQLAGDYLPVIDFHVHLRGGMTVEKALGRQAVTGINVGVLRNQGVGWPLETDDQLRQFLDSAEARPLFVGLQVNDRDWYQHHSPELLKRLDFILGDTMIMPMPDDDSPPVKLFQPDSYTIDDPNAWMQRYLQHNLRVLSEPITILANPTWLPPAVADLYDELWTDERMRQMIQAANQNNVALEINAESGYPRDRFLRMAKQMGAKFTFGSNNFDDRPIDMTRCLEAVEKYGLTKNDMVVPPGAAAINIARPWAKTEQNGQLARRILIHCRDYVRGWLAHADPRSGLIPRNLNRNRDYWNGRDSAADNYPFMVLTTSFTDRELYEGRMREMLQSERRLTSRVGPLPDVFSFETQNFQSENVDLARILFDSSEYVKDGLLPLTEWLGPSPWEDRMIEIVDAILDHADIETPAGCLPSTNQEVGGELMQILCRLYWKTGNQRYREFALRYADYFLFHVRPIEQDFLTLDDHGCEFIGGLSEVYLLAAKTSPEDHARFKPPLYQTLDRILEIGRNENGLFYMHVNPLTGDVLRDELTDNWGYDYNAYLTVSMVDDHEPYRQAVRHALENVHRHTGYPWEHDIADGYADSIESGLNLLNRIPVESGFQWVEHETEHMLAKQRDDGVIEGWHGDGNYARTALMVALWKTQGCSIHPWRADVSVGAEQEDGVLYISLTSDWPWSGKLHFDRPRHRDYFRLPVDYPRLNQFPEWFTVQAGQPYDVRFEPGQMATHPGAELLRGIPVTTDGQRPLRIIVR